jgi:drug/metabolite transporter (DMT)-like permease
MAHGQGLLPVDNMRGALWMLGSAVVFSSVSVLIKMLGQDVPAAEMVFFRCLFGLDRKSTRLNSSHCTVK